MADAGCRVGEAVAYHVSSLDPARTTLNVWGYKGGRWRKAPLTPRLQAALAALDHYQPPEPKSPPHRAVIRRLQRLLERFGLTPHQLRHSFATRANLAGIPLARIQSMLGHRTPTTTLIYLHAGEGSLADAAARLAALAAAPAGTEED